MTDQNTLYAGHDNPLVLNFTLNDAPQSLINATKISVLFVEPNLSYDTVNNPTIFDLSQASLGVVRVNLNATVLADGTYTLRVVVYDSINTHGIVYCHEKDTYPVQVEFSN